MPIAVTSAFVALPETERRAVRVASVSPTEYTAYLWDWPTLWKFTCTGVGSGEVPAVVNSCCSLEYRVPFTTA
jgi:hypothetical protein